jgi:hypothetical protein
MQQHQQLMLQQQQQQQQQQQSLFGTVTRPSLPMCKSIHIVDLRMARLLNCYPDMSDVSKINSIRLYYMLANQMPKLSDFNCVTNDHADGIWTIQVVVQGSDRAKTKEIAIAKLIRDMGLEIEKPPVEKQLFVGLTGTRQVHFVQWKLLQNENKENASTEMWASVRVRYHSLNPAVYKNDFVIGSNPDWMRGQNPCICEHSVPYEQRLNTETWDKEIQSHISKCLLRVDVPSDALNPHPIQFIQVSSKRSEDKLIFVLCFKRMRKKPRRANPDWKNRWRNSKRTTRRPWRR